MVLLQMWLDIVTSTNCKANLQSGRDVQLLCLLSAKQFLINCNYGLTEF
jgi:hypothetical protein